MRFDAELSWSKLDARPVIMYLPEQDDYMVAWNGVILPFVHAQCMAFEWVGVWVGSSVQDALNHRYQELYFAGAFGSRQWDDIALENNTYNFLKRYLIKHLEENMPKHTRKQIVEWFNLKNARTVEPEEVIC